MTLPLRYCLGCHREVCAHVAAALAEAQRRAEEARASERAMAEEWKRSEERGSEARRALETMRVALSWLTDEALAMALHEHCKVKNELVMAGRNVMPLYDVRPWGEITDRHREDHLVEARLVIEWFYHRDLHAAKVRAAL